MRTSRCLWDTYRFPGFWPTPTVQGMFGDPKARVIHLCRRGEKRHAARARPALWGHTDLPGSGDPPSPLHAVRHGEAGVTRRQSLRYQTLRFFRGTALPDHDDQGRRRGNPAGLEKDQGPRRAGTPAPKVVGIDEMSIRKGHTSRIVVSDLERRRLIWVRG
ncbi:MAG TPA: hypothetical protein PKD12_04015 [Nitrospira sp.]|nr:hypothetical protein [Nitrospira sp.]